MQALSALVNKSGVPRDELAKLQAPEDDGDESDEDFLTEAQQREAAREKYRGKLLSVIVDPIRKVLSGAVFLYPRLDADGTLDLVRPCACCCVT